MRKKEMNPIEKLIKAVGEHLVYNGPCDDADEDEGYCRDDECTYCTMARAFDEHQAAPKPWAPPWPLKIPDWANWIAVDSDGEAYFWGKEPRVSDGDDRWDEGQLFAYDTQFAFSVEIPPGMDWRTMKARVR